MYITPDDLVTHTPDDDKFYRFMAKIASYARGSNFSYEHTDQVSEAEINAVSALVSAMPGNHAGIAEPGYSNYCAMCFIKLLREVSLTIDYVRNMVIEEIRETVSVLAALVAEFFHKEKDEASIAKFEAGLNQAFAIVAAA